MRLSEGDMIVEQAHALLTEVGVELLEPDALLVSRSLIVHFGGVGPVRRVHDCNEGSGQWLIT